MNSNVERDINDIIDALSESKIEEENLDNAQVSFDKIVSILETNVSDISDDWEREKIKMNEIRNTLEKSDALPNQEESIHSDYCMALERVNEKIKKMNNYMSLYKKYLRILAEKLFEYCVFSVTKHSAEHFIEKSEKMMERLSNNQKLLNDTYVKSFMERQDEQRKDMKEWFRELFNLYRLNNEVLLKISDGMPTKELKDDIKKIIKTLKTTGNRLDEESKEVVPKKEDDTETEPEKETEEEELEECPLCKKKVKDLLEHLKSKHGDMNPIECKNCGEEFDNWDDLFKHKKTCGGQND